jgi:hypothetical protein
MTPVLTWNIKDQVLYVDWSESLGFPCVQEISSWSASCTVINRNDCDEASDLRDVVFDVVSESDNQALSAWQATVPVAVLEALRELPSDIGYMLYCASRYKGAYDLLLSNPGLFWLWIKQANPYSLSDREIEAELSKKQHYLLESIGLKGTKQTARLIRRLPWPSLKLTHKGMIIRLLGDEYRIKRFSHYREITYAILRASDRFPWAMSKPMERLLIDHWSHQTNQLIDDAVGMSMGQAIPALSRCTTMDDIARVHDRWVDRTAGDIERLRLDYDVAGLIKPFPEPPLPAGKGITPVTDIEGLLKEAEVMRHCVANYARRIQRGQYYVYHVAIASQGVEDLTLGLQVNNDHVVVDQLQGVNNFAPSEQACLYVENWLAQNGVSGLNALKSHWHRDQGVVAEYAEFEGG